MVKGWWQEDPQPKGKKEEGWEGLLANGAKRTPVMCSGEVNGLAVAAQESPCAWTWTLPE